MTETHSPSPTLYFIAGEHSGDARGAELMRSLRELVPAARFVGAGGAEMKRLAGGDFFDWADEAVVGLWDVLKKYGYFRAQFDRMLREIVSLRPTALILIDYPGFNLRMAKAVRKAMPGLKIIYYVSPQVWAWNRGRARKMARYLDLMLCIFPFEPPFFADSGLRAEFVGHPMLDSLAAKKLGGEREEKLIALLPGSRRKEVTKLFPVMLLAAREIEERRPGWTFAAAAANEEMAALMRQMLEETGTADEFCQIIVGGAHTLMQRATAGMVCSGTATLEAAYFGLPMCILYKVAWLTYVIGRQLVKVPHLGMPNLLAGREICREFIQDDAEPEQVAGEVFRLATDADARFIQAQALRHIIEKLGKPGAGTRAAKSVVGLLGLS